MKINREQQAASLGTGGVSLVIAGAGTGKTTTMILKIINCINSGIVTPEKALIMTFSRKAADEIRIRLGRQDKALEGIGFAGTFHSFCLSILKDYSSDYLQLKGAQKFPSLLLEEEKNIALRSIVMRNPERFLGMPCEAVLHLAENTDRLTPYMTDKLRRSPVFDELIRVNNEYSEYKLTNNLIDYEDMINDASFLIESSNSVKKDILDRFKYIFVDEFQDTSENNMKLLNCILPDRNRNLFMVGDDYQSIYKFRRAKVGYLINIKMHFPGAEIHKLTTNYRSKREIVNISNRFIRKNRFRTDKKIRSARGKGGNIFFHRAESSTEEAEIIREVLFTKNDNITTAILYRNNWQGAFIKKNRDQNLYPDVEMMTMHGSKGLEFDRVIIAGISDRIIPDRGSDLEEERRLFYVAMTRAKDELHIIYHKSMKGRLPRFIWELGFREE